MNTTTISSLVVAVVSLAGACTAYLKSHTTSNKLDAHLTSVKTDYVPPKGP